MSKKTTDIVSYIGFIGWIIAFVAGDKENSKFHLNQSLVVHIISLIVNVVTGFINGIAVIGLVGKALSLIVFIAWLLGLIYACQGKDQKVPVIGDIVFLK